jgi:hypothetical protein
VGGLAGPAATWVPLGDSNAGERNQSATNSSACLLTSSRQQFTPTKPHPIITAPPTRWRLLSSAIDQCCRYVFVGGYIASVTFTAINLITKKERLLGPAWASTGAWDSSFD